MRVSLGADAAQVNVDEVILGLWRFANALGLLTDVIGERTAAAGVTVDGLLIKDAGIPEAAVTAHEAALAILESQIADGTILARLAAVEIITGNWRFDNAVDFRARAQFNAIPLSTTHILRAEVTGDAEDRFQVDAAGKHEWGDGSGAVDTNLFRAAADELKTDDAFAVGGILAALDDLELSASDVTLTSGTKNNQASGTKTVLRILLSTGAVTITGFLGGRAGRILAVMNLGASALTLADEDSGSTAANRMLFTGAADHVLAERDIALLWYDGNTSRWKLLSSTV